VKRPPPSNLRSARAMVARLRREDRLDAVDPPLLVLLQGSAALVDQALAPSSDCPAYARAKIIATHGGLLAQIAERVSPLLRESSFDAFLHSLATPGAGAGDDDRL
jgi:hypothetical protein